jgi:hypothetical protein
LIWWSFQIKANYWTGHFGSKFNPQKETKSRLSYAYFGWNWSISLLSFISKYFCRSIQNKLKHSARLFELHMLQLSCFPSFLYNCPRANRIVTFTHDEGYVSLFFEKKKDIVFTSSFMWPSLLLILQKSLKAVFVCFLLCSWNFKLLECYFSRFHSSHVCLWRSPVN